MVRRICAVFGALMLCVFILGLAESISSGFAGFWGGLPFWVIAVAVLSMALYDAWEETFRNRGRDGR